MANKTAETLIRRKQKKFKKTDLITSKKYVTSNFSVDGRNTEITVDLVLQARAKMSDNKANNLKTQS